jgi:hypothetical protein
MPNDSSEHHCHDGNLQGGLIMTLDNPTLQRLDEQITWYGKKSRSNQKWFKRLKASEIIIAAAIPLTAGLKVSAIVTGILGVLVVVLEGLQGLNQFHDNWISYRSTCEELKHEKYLWLAKAGLYVNAANPDTLLAERVESLISREHAKWVSTREQAEEGQKRLTNKD